MIRVSAIQQLCNMPQAQAYQHSAELIFTASNNGADLVVLPELHSGAYFPQREDKQFFNLAQSIPGDFTKHFASVAKRAGVVLVSSMFEKHNNKYFNTAVVFDSDGTIAGIYRKTHIPEDPGFYEKFYFANGDGQIKPITTSLGKLGVLVCWDQWFPETARTMAARGANMLIYPTAIGTIPEDNDNGAFLDAWITIQRSHSIANALPVISVNRVGLEEDLLSTVKSIDFWGHSFITSAMGELLAQADETPQIIYADIKLDNTLKTRRMWPFYRDLRPSLYSLPRSICD